MGNILNRAFVGPEGLARERELGIGEAHTGMRLEQHERKTGLACDAFS